METGRGESNTADDRDPYTLGWRGPVDLGRRSLLRATGTGTWARIKGPGGAGMYHLGRRRAVASPAPTTGWSNIYGHPKSA